MREACSEVSDGKGEWKCDSGVNVGENARDRQKGWREYI